MFKDLKKKSSFNDLRERESQESNGNHIFFKKSKWNYKTESIII